MCRSPPEIDYLPRNHKHNSERTLAPPRRAPPPASTRLSHDTRHIAATMAGDLFELLVDFQPDSAQLKNKRDYDFHARKFVSELNNVSSSQWQKHADTPQDLLTVCAVKIALMSLLTPAATEPHGQLNSLRFFTSSSHPRHRRQAQRPRFTPARRRGLEQAGAIPRDF